MFQRIVVLNNSEDTERAIPFVKDVEVSEKDLDDAANYLAALKIAYANKRSASQAYSTDSIQEAARYSQTHFFC